MGWWWCYDVVDGRPLRDNEREGFDPTLPSRVVAETAALDTIDAHAISRVQLVPGGYTCRLLPRGIQPPVDRPAWYPPGASHAAGLLFESDRPRGESGQLGTRPTSEFEAREPCSMVVTRCYTR